MKISALPLLDPATMDGSEVLPVVKGGNTNRSTLGNVVDASFGPLASALAVALGNYRASYAQAVADIAVGQMFASDASGSMCLYRRIAAAPGYAYYDDVLTGGLARARTVSIDLAANIATRKLDASVTAIMTGGHTAAGIGGATYVSDGQATAALAAAYPALCKQSGDGRYWRLSVQHGAMAIEQAGAIPGDTTRAVANVAAVAAALAYLAALGGGTLTSGAGLFSFDPAVLGATGLAIPSGVSISGAKGAIWAVNGDQAACMLLTNTGTGTVWVEGNLELRGRVQWTGLTGGGMKRGVSITGKLSTPVQYADTGINVAAAFAGAVSYNDGKNAVPATDYTCTVSGSTVAITLSNVATLLGSYRYQRNIQSDYIALDPTARYVVAIADGFLSGAGGNQPIITLYDASKTAIDAGMSIAPYAGAAVNNVFDPQDSSQNGYRTAMIYGASYIRVQVGAYRGYGTAVGLTATFDLSKMTVLKVVADLAAQSLTNAPGDSGQVLLNSCSNMVVDGVSWMMIDRSCVKLIGCTNTHVKRCTGQYILQGATDDNGVGNSISDNIWDLRLITTGGALINSRAFRQRGIGGSGSQSGHYCRNIIYGASWGIELLPYNNTYSNVVSDNTVHAEYAGLSLGQGTWQVDNNRIYMAPAAVFGIECPGSTAQPNIMRGSGNLIQWSSFSGYRGFGIAAEVFKLCSFKGSFIKAPWIAQSIAAPDASSLLELDGVDGEFSASAILVRGPAKTHAHFSRLVASSVLSFPYVETTSTAIFDLNVTDTTASASLCAKTMVMGCDELLEEVGSADVRLSFPEALANPAGYITDYYFRINWLAATAKKVHFTDCRFINFPAAMTSDRWAVMLGTAYTGSAIYQLGCALAGARAYIPTGIGTAGAQGFANAIVHGDHMLVSYLVNVTIGTLADKGTVTFTGTMRGLPVSGGPGPNFNTYLADGMAGLALTNWKATADGAFSVTFTNVSGASKAYAVQSIRLQIDSSAS